MCITARECSLIIGWGQQAWGELNIFGPTLGDKKCLIFFFRGGGQNILTHFVEVLVGHVYIF